MNAQPQQVTEAEIHYFKDPNNPTLTELMRLMSALDDGLIDFDPELHAKTLGKTQVKLDNYKRFIDTLDAETVIVDQRIKEQQDYKKRLQSRKRGLENLLLYLAERDQLLPGVEYDLKIKTSTTTHAKVDPNEDLYFAFPELIRTKMEWKMVDVKKHLKEFPKSEFTKLVA